MLQSKLEYKKFRNLLHHLSPILALSTMTMALELLLIYAYSKYIEGWPELFAEEWQR